MTVHRNTWNYILHIGIFLQKYCVMGNTDPAAKVIEPPFIPDKGEVPRLTTPGVGGIAAGAINGLDLIIGNLSVRECMAAPSPKNTVDRVVVDDAHMLISFPSCPLSIQLFTVLVFAALLCS
jgi:hypothetical protein